MSNGGQGCKVFASGLARKAFDVLESNFDCLLRQFGKPAPWVSCWRTAPRITFCPESRLPPNLIIYHIFKDLCRLGSKAARRMAAPSQLYVPHSIKGQCVLITGAAGRTLLLRASAARLPLGSLGSPAPAPAPAPAPPHPAGASSGIGQACAWRFAEAGCKLVLVARRAERLHALKAQLVEKYQARGRAGPSAAGLGGGDGARGPEGRWGLASSNAHLSWGILLRACVRLCVSMRPVPGAAGSSALPHYSRLPT